MSSVSRGSGALNVQARACVATALDAIGKPPRDTCFAGVASASFWFLWSKSAIRNSDRDALGQTRYLGR